MTAMPARPLIIAWFTLAALSGATALLTVYRPESEMRSGFAAAVLVLAGFKARVILQRYLGLGQSRFWMRAFDLAIGGFVAVAFGIYLAGRSL